MNNLTYEVYAVFNKETNQRYSKWFSRKHDAITRKKKDFGWCAKEIQDKYYVARVKFTTEEFEVIDD